MEEEENTNLNTPTEEEEKPNKLVEGIKLVVGATVEYVADKVIDSILDL